MYIPLVHLLPALDLIGVVTSTDVPHETPSPPRASQHCGTSPILDADADAYLNQVLKDWKSPGGLAIAVVRRDKQGRWVNIETKGYGRADFGGDRVTEKTAFSIGPHSDLFTAVAAGLLISNDTLNPRLTWQTKVKDVIPDFHLSDPIATSRAHLLDLFSHRTGYPGHDLSYRYSDTERSFIKKMQHQRQSTEFRQEWQYNSNMYTILSRLPKALTGQNFPQYVKQHIFDPLNMTSTMYSFAPLNADDELRWMITGDDSGIFPSLGVITNAVDMATWLQALLLNGRDPKTNAIVIPPSVLPKLASPVAVQSTAPAFKEESAYVYGAGQMSMKYRGYSLIEHTSSVAGFNSRIARLPDHGLGVAIMTNDHDFGQKMSQVLKYYVIDKVLCLDPIDWNTRLRTLQASTSHATPPPAHVALPHLNFTAYAGNYVDPGYGKLEMCLIQPYNPNQSENCAALSSNVDVILPGAIRPGIPTYLSTAVDSPWFSHIKMEHFNGNLFNVSLLISTPTGKPEEPYRTFNNKHEIDNGQTAEVDDQDGRIAIGMAGLWSSDPWGVKITPKPVGHTPKERAEVYWEKVSSQSSNSLSADSESSWLLDQQLNMMQLPLTNIPL